MDAHFTLRTLLCTSIGALRAGFSACALAVGFGLIFFAPATIAQQSDDDPFAGIEEMVVTATGAANIFQNQEVSAIAFDSDYLDAIGANNISDISTFTPNLEIRTPFAASNPTLFIRGVGLRDFNANSSSSVAVYNDEIYMNSPAGQLAQLFDTENIDVLRGPQTTMYGRNASAGAIRVVARKPTHTPGMSGSVTYGRFNELNFEAAVENVLIEDTLSIRSAARWNQRDGTTKNRCGDIDYALPEGSRFGNRQRSRNPALNKLGTVADFCYSRVNTDPANRGTVPPYAGWTDGVTAPVNEWVNDTRNWAARSIVRLQLPQYDTDWQLNVHCGQNRGDARQFQHVGAEQAQGESVPTFAVGSTDAQNYLDADARLLTPSSFGTFPVIRSPFSGDPFEGDYNNVKKEEIDLFGASLVGSMTFGDFSVTMITGYEWNERDTTLDLDASPTVGLEPRLTNTAYQLTEEIRLDYDAGEGFSWQLAGMFLYEGLEVDNLFSLNPLLELTRQEYRFFTRYGAIWGTFDWEPAETFKLHAGLRGNLEDKELDLQTTDFQWVGSTLTPQFVDGDGNALSRGAASAGSEYGWAGDVTATWSPVADVNLYARYARGWKGPHINGGITNPGPPDSERGDLATPVKPEIVDSIELGLKSEFWDNRIRWNWAFFYYDYQDIQVFQLRNAGGSVPVQQLINAQDADVVGFEMELDVKPFEGWAPPIFEGIWIRGTFAWLDSKYTDFVNAQDIVVDNGSVISKITVIEDYSGSQLVNSPEFSFIGFAMWPIGGEWGTLIPRVDWSFKDKVYFGPANAEMVSQEALWLWNFRAIYKTPMENFELSFWVENLTDQAYTVDVFNLARLRGAILHAIGDPRTYGLTAKVSF